MLTSVRYRWFVCLIAAAQASAQCPVTLPASSPVTVPGQPSNAFQAWYGSDALAVLLPADGRWRGMGKEHRFRDKFWVWRRGYDVETEARPALTFQGVELRDGGEPRRLEPSPATNAYGNGWSSMLALLEFPAAGCWRVTASYVHEGIEQQLAFTVEVIE